MTGNDAGDRETGAEEPEGGAQARLRHSETLHRALTENLPDTTVFLLDPQLRMLVAEGEAVREQRAWLREDLLAGAPLPDPARAVPIHASASALGHFRAALAGERRSFELRSGDRHLSVQAIPVFGDAAAVEAVLVTVRDVSAQREVEARLARRAGQQAAVAQLGQLALDDPEPLGVMPRVVAALADVLQAEYAAVLALSDDATRLEVVASAGFGARAGESYGVPVAELSQTSLTLSTSEPVLVEDYEAETRFEPHPMLVGLGVRSAASVLIAGRDRPYGVLAVLGRAPRRLSEDDVDFLRSVANLLSAALQRHADEQRYRHAAMHDALTGLPNRTLILDRLMLALRRREREGRGVAVMMLDLDGFKVINDSLGHRAGDQLLLALAPRLRDAVRVNDSVGRLGGDEFVAVCEVAGGPSEAAAIARRMAAEVARPVELEGAEHRVTASIGIAVAAGEADSPDSLLRDADAAMYRAKARGRGRIELFDDAMRDRVVRRLSVENELRRGLEAGDIRVHYQPVFDVHTGRIVGAEALMRWQHPERGLLLPSEFLEVAEETGLIVAAGRFVLEQACLQVARWQARFDSDLCLSVNVSARELSQPDFAQVVTRAATETGLRRGSLGLETTETVLLEETGAGQPVLAALVREGLRVELDGFGTGFSSLAFLRRFPLEALKIDRSLVVDVERDPAAAAIVEAVIAMSARLGVRAVVEGIENQDQLDRVVVLGARRVQGFHLARPLPADELEERLPEMLGGA